MLAAIVNRSAPLPPGAKLLILGGGFTGQRLAEAARALGAKVLCSRRTNKSKGADFAFDSSTKQPPCDEIFQGTTHLISSIPPATNGEDPVLQILSSQLKNLSLEWVGYLSTTGVYGDCQGNWVSENDYAKPKQLRSKRRLECEKAWQASGLPIQILRLPGIYGPGRSAIDSIQSGKNKMVDKPGQVFSRIHVDDIVGAILHLINLQAKGNNPDIVNISDNLPTSNVEVLQYAAHLLGHDPPPIQSFEDASKHMNPMALSFWQENRRVSNHRLCKELGYSLIHADYKSGLKACLLHNQ